MCQHHHLRRVFILVRLTHSVVSMEVLERKLLVLYICARGIQFQLEIVMDRIVMGLNRSHYGQVQKQQKLFLERVVEEQAIVKLSVILCRRQVHARHIRCMNNVWTRTYAQV